MKKKSHQRHKLAHADTHQEPFDGGALPYFVLGMEEPPKGAQDVAAMIRAFEHEQIERWQEAQQESDVRP